MPPLSGQVFYGPRTERESGTLSDQTQPAAEMSVQELEAAISELPPEQLAALAEWFDDFRSDAWDRQIEADAAAGRLDALVSEAQADIAAGRTRPLP